MKIDTKKIKLVETNLKSFAGKNPIDIAREIEMIEKHGVEIITIDDGKYPENLKHIYDPPSVLYIKGKLLPDDYFNIAIVGSRHASLYGLQNAERLARQLAERSFTITSGMARGIDTSAHNGALKANGRTIAVLGCGINIIYPPENKALAEKIIQNGAIISEFPMDTPPSRYNFPRRNRVISGLSLGVVVVEAAQKSGALITASFALEQGREVFSVPGRIDMPTSRGTLGLIKQGAKVVEGVEDIVEELACYGDRSLPDTTLDTETCPHSKSSLPDTTLDKPFCGDRFLPDTTPYTETCPRRMVKLKLTEEESKVFESLSDEPKHIDEILDLSGLEFDRLSDALLKLELKKAIKQLPGKIFVRS